MKPVSETFFPLVKSIFHGSKDAISLMGKDCIFQYVNPAFEQLYGLAAKDVIGKNVWSFWPENTDDMRCMSEAVKRGEGIADFETRRKRPDGTYVDVSLTITPIELDEGDIAYLTVDRDITERKRMERSLREVEAMFRLIEENISDTVSIFNVNGEYVYASESHRQFFGTPPEELLGRRVLQRIHEDDIERVRSAFRKTIKEKTRCKAECRVRHQDGRWVSVESAISPVLDEDGNVTKVISVSRDITDRKYTDQLLLQSEKLSVVGQFGAALAHEVRNPLTTIKGFLQLMTQDSAYNRQYIELVMSEIGRIENIIEEFLATSRPQESDYAKVDLHKVLEQSVAMMLPAAHMSNVGIETEIGDEELPIYGDDMKLKQVFVNLMKNGIESMTQAGILKVGAYRTAGGVIHVDVIDQGCGMSPEALSKIGDPFYTTKQRGTGLGLSVSLRILREHQAQIAFESEVGKGTKVSIEFPPFPAAAEGEADAAAR
ncbi:PAS domain S-box protein [Alicyclobacillus cycloheptanicus]|uniref:histidine kinase n=1 Tax=Alicyclobacillus cycloheptanicus TaxID=1457 RepID=A0ABT9XHP5_9BACL|nr:PAS domain-containing sensor histidine kinase [Alicyclobacillus cycloheptanicus]MDQ0189834.1 two-component system sporulation sensor kinase A [Alicyclobacillus cycloheptanicus]WDM02479.1 PAS domain S-box protein [Alicyclobacillus cycloheptanicus]